MHAFVLDLVGPLVQLLELCQSGIMEQDEAILTLFVAITLLGNTSPQISRLRRKKVLKELNADIQDLANKEDIFKEAAPKPFGNGFERIAKEMAEAEKLLKEEIKKPFFEPTASPTPRGEAVTNHFEGAKTVCSLSFDKEEKTFKRPNPSKESMSTSSNCFFRHYVMCVTCL